MNKLVKIASTVTLAGLSMSTLAFASTPARPIDTHRTVLGFLHPDKPLFAGNIIGNKKTHVYHMQGDPGALPAPKNRVYFRTEAQAVAAGFHRAGTGHRRMGPVHPAHHRTMPH